MNEADFLIRFSGQDGEVWISIFKTVQASKVCDQLVLRLNGVFGFPALPIFGLAFAYPSISRVKLDRVSPLKIIRSRNNTAVMQPGISPEIFCCGSFHTAVNNRRSFLLSVFLSFSLVVPLIQMTELVAEIKTQMMKEKSEKQCV